MVIVDVLPLCAFHIHSSIERLHHVLFSPAIPMQEVGFQMGLVLWVSVKRSYFNKSITRRLIDPICVDVSTPVTLTHVGWLNGSCRCVAPVCHPYIHSSIERMPHVLFSPPFQCKKWDFKWA